MPQSTIPHTDKPRQRPGLALIVRLFAVLGWATMVMLIKLASERNVDLPQMLFVRQAVTIPILLGWMAMRGNLGAMRTKRLKSHASRALAGTIGMVFNFASPMLLPLAVAATFGFTTPLFAVVLAFAVLREHVGLWRWTATFIGFLGILVVMNPFEFAISPLGTAVGICAAFMVALISIQIRDLSQTEDPIAIVTWFAIFSSPVLLMASFFTSWDLGAVDWLILLSIGLTGTVSQIMITVSLRLGSVSSVIVMDYSMLLWATFYGWFVFGAFPPFTLWLGAPLIIAAGAIIVWRERVLAKENASRAMV
ncbi:DMT family transporter [Croceicoccus bisphenolivorans]|uniref:DMT family transporter n=1 Tax=Croceicoccus bisphenolivorans TaxID=1783232 RepID=UPI0008354BFF|nr:DMT family transporter [Croceicoccus bisphenolivorans]